MTDLRLSEPIVDAAILKLQQGIPARAAAVNADRNDSISIEAPTVIYAFGVPGPIQAPAYVVTPFGESPQYTGDGPHGFEYSDQLAVMILEEDPDRERVGRKLLRQQRAVIECLWDDQPREALTGSAYTIQPVRHILGPTFEPTDDVSSWRAYLIQIFLVQQQEGD